MFSSLNWTRESAEPSQLLIGANGFDKLLRRTLDYYKDGPWVSGSTDLLRPDLQDEKCDVSSSTRESTTVRAGASWHGTSLSSYVTVFPSFRAAMSRPIAAVPLGRKHCYRMPSKRQQAQQLSGTVENNKTHSNPLSQFYISVFYYCVVFKYIPLFVNVNLSLMMK